jgi:prepilin-type N-terminal cleavage/methylation domain-containing protein
MALRTHRRARLPAGFTLIELAVVLFLVALLLGGLLGPVSLRLDAERRREGIAYLEEVRAALMGFALRNGRLPCPDNDGTPDGLGNSSGNPSCPTTIPRTCNTYVGGLPYAQIGMPATDPWGRPLRYHVTSSFVADPRACSANIPALQNSLAHLTLAVDGGLSVSNRRANKTSFVAVQGAAAVLVSRGASDAGTARAGSDEANNLNTTTILSRPPNRVDQACSDTDVNQPSCHFDDLVVWIPATVLQYQLVTGGRLPP